MLIITHGNGDGMEIAFAGTDGDEHTVQWGRLGTDLNFKGTEWDGDKCSQWRIQDLQTGGKVERRRREDRGAKGADGVEFGEEVSGHCPLPRKFFDFVPENGDF